MKKKPEIPAVQRLLVLAGLPNSGRQFMARMRGNAKNSAGRQKDKPILPPDD